MKQLLLFATIALIVMGCRKKDGTEPPPADKFGEVLIVISDDLDFLTSAYIDATDYTPSQTRNADCAHPDNSAKKIKLKTGTYDINARNSLVAWNTKVIVSENECEIINLNSSNTIGEKKGSVIFYNDESGMRKINVRLDGKLVGSILENLKGPRFIGPTVPAVVAILSPGTYNYQAESENGQKWEGSVTLINGKSTELILGRSNAKSIDANESNLIFYSPITNSGGPFIDVYLDGEYIGHTLSNYDPSIVDLCTAKWAVSVIKPKGTYSYTASSHTGKKWSGSVTAAGAGDCCIIKLE
ncbi:hypothetical protein GZH53_01065 [Flavihumibacter sp. R14]|nr:hypothetical protein [Flavihumibacter soli]